MVQARVKSKNEISGIIQTAKSQNEIFGRCPVRSYRRGPRLRTENEISQRESSSHFENEISQREIKPQSKIEISQRNPNADFKNDIFQQHPGADSKAPKTNGDNNITPNRSTSNTTSRITTHRGSDTVRAKPNTKDIGKPKSPPDREVYSADPSYVPTPEEIESDQWLEKIYGEPKYLPLTTKLYCFHSMDAKGKPTGVVDARIYKYLTHTQHIFVCGEVPYIYQGGCYHADVNRGAILKTMISDCILEQYVKSTTIERIYKLFLQRRELIRYPEELNDHSGWYINFKNGMYDVKRQRMYEHSPKILSVNQIPWEYNPKGGHGSGTEIEKFLRYAIPDEDDREMLLEYMGLCLTTDTDQQKMLVITGLGGTGKSTIINLIQAMVGYRNISNVPMGRLSEKFQAITMMGKLLNSCADLEIDALDDVTNIKKIIGEDYISDSYKGKDNVAFKNYAKMLFSTNELPLVRNEKTQGFYRRILALPMNQMPKDRDPQLQKKLMAEMPYLIDLSVKALKRMYDRGYILESQNSKDQTRQLRIDSDTVEAFLEACCVNDPVAKTPRPDLFEKYTDYCKEWDRQSHQKLAFFRALRNKGYREAKYSGTYVFYGLRLKDADAEGFMDASGIDTGDIPFGI